jgi:hypothetical protein
MRFGLLLSVLFCHFFQDAAKPVYDFPFPAGKSIRILQGNGVGTHTGNLRYSWDFLIPVGDVVVAARDGTVAKISDQRTAKRGAGVLILHDDGTCATYGHLQRGAMLVKKGERVLKGEPIGKVGPESGCPTPHLHFHVTSSGRSLNTIPLQFKGSGGSCNPTGGDMCASTTAEPPDLSQLRLLRRALPLLVMATRIDADDLIQEMKKALAPAQKNSKLAPWARPYEKLGSPARLELAKDARSALVDALRHDFKGEWDRARPLYEKAMKDASATEAVRPLHEAITPVVQ